MRSSQLMVMHCTKTDQSNEPIALLPSLSKLFLLELDLILSFGLMLSIMLFVFEILSRVKDRCCHLFNKFLIGKKT